MSEILFVKESKNTKNKVVLLPDSDEFEVKEYQKTLNECELEILKKVKQEKDHGTKFKVYDFVDAKMAVAFLPKNPKELDLQIVGGNIAQKMKDVEEICCCIGKNAVAPLKIDVAAYNIAFGFELGEYSFDKYFTTKKASEYSQIDKFIIAADGTKKENYADFAAVANAVRYARDLTNEPANYLLPEVYAADIKRLEYLGLEVEILEEKELKEIGFNLLLSVAQGSENPPRVAILKWKGNKKSDDFAIGFVGKGVCFDSGGLSLKTGGSMQGMHHDMAGSAAVVATLKAAALQKVKANVIGIVGLVENMPSGHATRVNDIVSSLSGQTVEILNTDAEGRLVLADCLWYLADNYHPEYMVDIATLTGAVANLFGREFAGVMGNDEELINNLRKAGDVTGEKLWELPLTKTYDDMIKSDVADMKNIGGKIAGGMTAACFLQRFVQKGIKWAHVDMAGVDDQEKAAPLYPKGATGWGVMLFNRLIKDNFVK